VVTEKSDIADDAGMLAGVRKAGVEWAVVGRALGPGGEAVSGQGARSQGPRIEPRYRRAGLSTGKVVAPGSDMTVMGEAGLSDRPGKGRSGSDGAGAGGAEVG
jgi:hypothetical protein